MTTAGTNITKANIVASMEAIRTSYNSGIVWHSGNQPFQTDITGGNASGYSTESFSAAISDTNVTASTIVANFRSYATLLSRIRSVRLLKWFQIQSDVRARLDFDETNLTNLNSTYAADMSSTGSSVPSAGNTVSGSGVEAFVSSLSTAINNNRTNTVTIEEFYCHSNCHGSCHGSI
jgi:hypothetical protein